MNAKRDFHSVRNARLRAILCLALSLAAQPRARAAWKYFRTGSPQDSSAKPQPGFALMGGGPRQDPAFRFLCERSAGGDFLILRANTEDDYAKQVNGEIAATCPLNSVATIVFSDREDSSDPKLLAILRQAETIFIAGGDQSNYVRFWQDTPVQDALDRHIAEGKPLGGSSAGLAVLGEFSFSSMIDTIHSPEALADPYGNKVTLSAISCESPCFPESSRIRISSSAIVWGDCWSSWPAFCRTAGPIASARSPWMKTRRCCSNPMENPSSSEAPPISSKLSALRRFADTRNFCGLAMSRHIAPGRAQSLISPSGLAMATTIC